MKTLLTILIFTLTINLGSELTNKSFNMNKEIVGNWKLKEGWFPEQDLKFENSSKDNDYLTFKFNGNGTIEYLYQFKGDCQVGEFTMKDGKWKLEGDFLTVEIRGLKISDYWYWYILKYKIVKFDHNNLELEIVNIIKNKEIKPTLTWGDLIHD